MKSMEINNVSASDEEPEKNEVDLDKALDLVGLGWYNAKYCAVLGLFLVSSIVEVVGYSYILPSAKCDLEISDAQRGVIASLPYVAIALTSFPWGYLVDTRGRKSMLIASSLMAGVFGMLAAIMPELISFVVFKFLTAICITCPSAAPYVYIGEILPRNYRDLVLSITNALQISGAALVPLFGWGILPLDFRWDLGLYDFRSWRLLCIIYSTLFLLCGFLLSFGPESPKYLVSKHRHEEALKILQTMYAANKGVKPENFPVKSLKMPEERTEPLKFISMLKNQTLPLLKIRYLKWLCLNGFLLFGIFASLNGLFMWVPDILNRVLSGSNSTGMTACQVIRQRFDESPTGNVTCNDSIESSTFIINFVANTVCAILVLALSATLNVVGKRLILTLMYFTIGVFCILVNFITIEMVFAMLLASIQMLGLGIGPIQSYSVQIFPTLLRGMAVSLSMMIGRIGSIIGTNVAGILINSSCETTFYLFGGSLLICGFMTFLLPRSR